jgi:hypothetical protein
MIRIGIDPDLKLSGFCVLEQNNILQLTTLPFFPMIENIKLLAIDYEVVVYIEAGWLNKTKNYHGAINKSVAARIGANVGENHAIGKKIEEAMLFYGIPYKLIRPTSQKWNAKSLLINTGYSKRTNQEERDALKLIWGL